MNLPDYRSFIISEYDNIGIFQFLYKTEIANASIPSFFDYWLPDSMN